MLHGVNVVAKDAPYYPCAFGFNQSDVAWLSGLGMEVVRLGVLPSGEMPTRGKIDQSYIANLMATVNELSNEHIYILLDWHQDNYGTFFDEPGTNFRADGMPSWMTLIDNKKNVQVAFPYSYAENPALQQAFQSFWDNQLVPGGKSIQDYYLEMLQAVAKEVSGNPWVLGYEVMNEPWPGVNWTSCVLSASGCPNEDKSELDAFYQKAALSIREVDKNHMIFIEPFSSFNYGIPTSITSPPGVKNVGLAFHQYAQTPLGEQGVFTNALNWSNANGGALLNTEWSANNNDPATISSQAEIADSNLASWTYWLFDNCDIACSKANGVNMLFNPFKAPTGSNVESAVVANLVRPYPFVISGTPTSLSFDPTSKVMDFTWSTTKANNAGRFGPGSLTSIETPSNVYPTGYTAVVIGGKVISKPCSPMLEIEQNQVLSQLSLTVKPSGSCSS